MAGSVRPHFLATEILPLVILFLYCTAHERFEYRTEQGAGDVFRSAPECSDRTATSGISSGHRGHGLEAAPQLPVQVRASVA